METEDERRKRFEQKQAWKDELGNRYTPEELNHVWSGDIRIEKRCGSECPIPYCKNGVWKHPACIKPKGHDSSHQASKANGRNEWT